MKFFLVQYTGSYLGGAAVVAAESSEQALDLVAKHKLTIGFEDVTVDEIPAGVPGVLYNDNGEY